MLKLYNTLSNAKENFIPRNENCITMYVCGPTVYDEIHVGNARSLLVFDMLYRILLREFPHVQYVRNITDIDDKIIQKANQLNQPYFQVAKFWENSFEENCIKLNLLKTTQQPRATDNINEIIEAIAKLIEEDFAYIEAGHVLFRVDEIDNYGSLSKQFNQLEGARIAIAEYKEDKRDFVLWKPSKLNEPYWNSPWGKGRPGWHIECSVMSSKFLGQTFDIHAGGQDLIFPHHENEQAQNIGLFGNFAGPRYWIHNAMVLFENQKMSKSLGNVVRLSQAFEKYDPLMVRFFILSTHYRHVLIWKEESIAQSNARYKRWIYHLNEYIDNSGQICDEFYQALLNDLNMPEAMAIFENKLKDALENQDKAMLSKLANTMEFLGVMKKQNIEISDALNEKLSQRNIARFNKNYELADALRKEIEEQGFEIVDSYEGSFLKRKIE